MPINNSSPGRRRLAESQELNFEVSTGLKRVLGRELITDDEVALFELVKNSFDAKATQVIIHFSNASIWVIDNGIGMSYEDIISKWLFVAYSAKRNSANYRDQVVDRRCFAGSKGIGRFSSDRLGKEVILQTRPHNEPSGLTHRVEINWERFEGDDKIHFDKIPVTYHQTASFSLPTGIASNSHGTAIEIRHTRTGWIRNMILHLKSSLAKLINPFGAAVDGFQIIISAPAEEEADQELMRKAKGNPLPPNNLVNGEVGNFIFSDLRSKTTFLEMEVVESTNSIETKLTDRGELIYHISEKNPYNRLNTSGFRCELYYLNRSAKITFTNRVGLPSVQFGSVFLFRNGFRVFPIGEDGNDWFGINRRKQQGFARFLGTREIIGRIDVSGNDTDFQEASSRNQGLIETPAVKDVKDCFREHCLKRLEKYVVPVSWVDKAEKDTSDLSRLLTDSGRIRVSTAVASLVDNEDIELLNYSRKLVSILNERSKHFESSLVSLRQIAEKTQDKTLINSIEKAERRFEELKESEAEARRIADTEREAKEIAQKRAAAAELTATSAQSALHEEKVINRFLHSVGSLDVDTILNMHHQITIYAVDIDKQIENFVAEIANRETVSTNEIISAIEQIAFLNRKVKAVSKYATKANFRLDSEEIEGDLARYISEYIEESRDFAPPTLSIVLENNHPGFARRFKPFDISVVIDNFISNSKKSRSTVIHFQLYQPKNRKNTLRLNIHDDGRGFDKGIDTDRVFEKGYTTTDGAGLGLYHVRQILGEMKGSVRVDEHHGSGAMFVIEVTNK